MEAQAGGKDTCARQCEWKLCPQCNLNASVVKSRRQTAQRDGSPRMAGMDGVRYKELLRHFGKAKNEERWAAEAETEIWEGVVIEEEEDWDVDEWRGGREWRSSVNLDGMVVCGLESGGEDWRSSRRNRFHVRKALSR